MQVRVDWELYLDDLSHIGRDIVKKKKKKNLCQSIKFLDIMVVRKCQETKDVTLKSSNPECKIEHYSFLKGKKKISITKIK